MKKKIVTVFLATAAALCLAGCSGNTGAAPAGGQDTAAEPSAEDKGKEADAAPAAEDKGKEAGEAQAGTTSTPTDIYERISSSFELPDMYLADDDWLMNYYGIDASLLSDYVFAEADEVHADRVIMLKVKDTADVPAMTEKLQAVLDQLSSPEMLSYLPDQEDIITSASVKTEGDLIYLVISPDAGAIEAMIQGR